MRRKYRALGFSLIILTSLCPPASAARQGNALPDLWLMKARQLTDELVKDADALGPRERALLWARLGEVWWREDAGRARAWMQKAVEAAESVPHREGAAERAERLSLARELLRVVAPKDKALRARLLSLFTTDTERPAAAEGNTNADALMQTAVAVLKQDLYWTLLIAHDLKIDLTEGFGRKMAENARKYPVERSHGSSRKYTELATDPSLKKG
jgi:hypothetical protein